MTAPVSAIAALIAPLLGRTVIATDKHGAESTYTITKLSDKIGTLKDGSKGEYVILSKDGETGVVMNVHPNTVKKLATKGEGDMLRLVAVGETDEQANVAAELAAEQSGKPLTEAQYQAAALQAAAEMADAEQTAPVDEAPAAAAPKVSKKSQTIAIFTEMTAAGKVRKEIIAKMQADLGLSDACANTYYQNCKSGAWA